MAQDCLQLFIKSPLQFFLNISSLKCLEIKLCCLVGINNWQFHYFLFFSTKGNNNYYKYYRWANTYSSFQIYQWIILTSLTVQQSCNHTHTIYELFKTLYWRYIIMCLANKAIFKVIGLASPKTLCTCSYTQEWMANRELYCWGLIPSPKTHSTVSLVVVALGHVWFCQTRKTIFWTWRVTKTKWLITLSWSSLNNPAQMCVPPGTDSAEHWGCQCRSRSRTTADSWRRAPQSDNRLQNEWYLSLTLKG